MKLPNLFSHKSNWHWNRVKVTNWNVCSVSDNGPCLGWRESPNKPYQWLHYNETLLRAKNFGSGLVALGLSPSPNTFIGIYSQNCPEWVLTEQGAYCYSMVIVPLYDTLGPDACAYIIKQGMRNESSYLWQWHFRITYSRCTTQSVLSVWIHKKALMWIKMFLLSDF